MLAAVLHNKAGRVMLDDVEHNVNWRQLFHRNEDLLTAVVFGRVKYLSTGLQSRFLHFFLGTKAGQFGPIEDVVFWPSFKASEFSHSNTRRVEPDVILMCNKGWIVMEVKPPFGGKQYKEQWQNEILALVAEAEHDGSEYDIPDMIGFVAFGNTCPDSIHDICCEVDTKNYFSIIPNKLEWEQLFSFLEGLPPLENAGDSSIIADWFNAFNLFGIIHKPEPLTAYKTLAEQLHAADLILLNNMTTDSNEAIDVVASDWRDIVPLSDQLTESETLWTSLQKNWNP